MVLISSRRRRQIKDMTMLFAALATCTSRVTVVGDDDSLPNKSRQEAVWNRPGRRRRRRHVVLGARQRGRAVTTHDV